MRVVGLDHDFLGADDVEHPECRWIFYRRKPKVSSQDVDWVRV